MGDRVDALSFKNKILIEKSISFHLEENNMSDKIFEELLKKASVNSALDSEVMIKVSADELTTLRKKAAKLEMSIEDLVRVYVVNTTAFDKSHFEGKKSSRKAVKPTDAGENNV